QEAPDARPSARSLDTTSWQPRTPSTSSAPEDFTAVVGAGAGDEAAGQPLAARHPRGSVVTAALGASVSGAAAAVTDTTRRAVDVVRGRVSAGADKVSAAAAARAAEREA